MTRLRDLGLVPLAVGQQVVYTYRACGVQNKGRTLDLTNYERRKEAWAALGYPGYGDRGIGALPCLPQPADVGNRYLDRWVVEWPQAGRGVVTELAYRYRGVTSGGYGVDDAPIFEQRGSTPLYVVRQRLRGDAVLVPPAHCYPILDGWSHSSVLLGVIPDAMYHPSHGWCTWDDYVHTYAAPAMSVVA